jgi:hypothetical protein
MAASSSPIERSFEIAAARCEDLTPLVYRRLFDAHPEAQTMFRTEGSELVKGSMLALTIDRDPGLCRSTHRPFPPDRMRSGFA